MLFLVDFICNLKFLFPPGSLGRAFFFNEFIGLLAFLSPIFALTAYFSGVSLWARRHRLLFAILLLPPIGYSAIVIVWAYRFAQID
jgi:hypothetical protein